MTDLFICTEENSYIASKVCKKINQITKKDILPFYIIPWHSFINRMEEDGVNKGVNLWSMYSKESIEKRLSFYNENISLENLDDELINKLALYINLDQSQISDLSNRSYHDDINKIDMLNFLDYLAIYFIDVIEKYNPENIYDLNTQSYLRKLLFLITEKRKIKYKSIIHSLFNEYVLSTNTLGEEINKEYNSINLKSQDIEIAKETISSFRKKESILNIAEQEYSAQLEKPPIIDFVKRFYVTTRFTLRTYLNRRRSKLKIPKRTSGFMKIINPSLRQGYLYNLKCIFNLLKAKINKESELNLEDYYYFPLGYTLENISASTTGNILSDLEIINKLRIFMNPFSKIIVKEHRSMISERNKAQKIYLKKLKKNSIYYIGEKVISNKENNPLRLILNSKGVIVQSGTTGLEGLLLNKPTLIFGNPIYSKFIPKFIDPDSPDDLFKFLWVNKKIK